MSPTLRLALSLLLALFAAACGRRIDALQPPGSPWRNPLAWSAEGFLPFPADAYRQDGRLRLPREVWTDRVVDRAPTLGDDALRRINARDGFSPNLPIVFGVPGRVGAAALPSVTGSTAPEATVRLVDLADGAPVAFEAEQREIDDTADGTATIVLLLPRARLRDGATYLVTVHGLTDDAGRLIAPAPAAAQNFAGDAPALAAVREALARYPAPPGLQLAYTFTVATNLDAPFVRLHREIGRLAARFPARFDHHGPARHWFPPLKPGTAWDLTGTFDGWRFVGERGEIWPAPRRHAVPLMLSLPERCPPGGCPVVIFCHGLQANKETMYQVAGPLNAAGIAVIGLDGLWHESFPQTQHVVDGLHERYDIFSGLVYQHVAYQWQLVELLNGSLRSLDVLPAGAPDGVPDLDPSHLGYIGQSLGGIAGVTVMAHEPRIDAGIFNVAGGGFYQMFTRSMLRWMIRVPMFDIDGLSPSEGYTATLFATVANDFVDPLVAAGRLAADPRPKLLQAGLDDGLVPNESSDLLARSLGLHLVEPPPPGKADGVPVDPQGRLFEGYSFASWGVGAFAHHLALNSDKQADEAVRFFTAALLAPQAAAR